MKKEVILTELSNIEISEIFFRRLINHKDCEGLKNELKRYAARHNYKLDILLYFFIKKTIDDDIFFLSKKNENKLGDIFIYVIKWASLIENKKIDRISTASKIKENKKKNLYIDLQTSSILSIQRINKNKYFLQKALIKDILLLFFEMRDIKRKTFKI